MTNEEIIQAIRNEIERLKGIGGIVPLDNREQKTGYESALIDVETFLDTLESETTYDGQQYTPKPSVSIEDVARVQFASHAKVFDKKRKAVFDWEQFKEVAGIFYGFGKKDRSDTLESEKPINPDDAMKELDEKIALVKQRGTWDGVDVDKYMDEVRGREPEKPMNLDDGLVEEVNRYYSDNFAYISSDQPTLSILTNIARHFAEWQKEQDEEEQADLFTIVALDAAQRAKEQMMKETVEGKIIFLLNGDVAVNIGDTDKYNLGQKIRVIVLPKEDEK